MLMAVSSSTEVQASALDAITKTVSRRQWLRWPYDAVPFDFKTKNATNNGCVTSATPRSVRIRPHSNSFDGGRMPFRRCRTAEKDRTFRNAAAVASWTFSAAFMAYGARLRTVSKDTWIKSQGTPLLSPRRDSNSFSDAFEASIAWRNYFWICSAQRLRVSCASPFYAPHTAVPGIHVSSLLSC